MSKRGFLDKRSNCWVSSLLQVLHYSPPPDFLAISKEPFAATLYSLFQKMVKDTLVPKSIVAQLTITCLKLTIETLKQGVKYVQS